MHSDRFATRLTERASGWLSEHAPDHPALRDERWTTGRNRTDTPTVADSTDEPEEDTIWLPTVNSSTDRRDIRRPPADADGSRRLPTDAHPNIPDSSVGRRLATRYDHDLLRAIFTECASATFASLPISLAAALLDSQFRAHRMDRQQHWPDAVDQIIEVRGVPAGRLMLVVRDTQLRILDLGLLTGFRHQGVGRTVLADLTEQAGVHGLSLGGALAKDNRRLPLYLQCGLEVVAETDTYFELDRAC